MRRFLPVALLLAFALTTTPGVSAQQMPGMRRAPRGWAPAIVGVKFGYDYNSTGEVAGVELHLPVLASGRLELVPNGDVSFLTGLKEYQYGVDAVLVSGGRRGGLFAGGGIGWRSSIFPGGPGVRETKRSPVAVAGVRTGPILDLGISTQIAIRWVFVDTKIKPRVLTFGLNLPLWGWGSNDGR